MKFDLNWPTADKSQQVILKSVLVLALMVAIDAFASFAQAQSGSRSDENRRPSRSQSSGEQSGALKVNPISDVSVAREKAKKAKKKFETVQKLSRLGSASQKQLREAELIKWLALLDLSDLVSPESRPENSLLRARLVFSYRNQELEVIDRLYRRGAASKLELRRAKTNRDVAKSRLKAVQSETPAQRKVHVITAASSKYQEAQKEHQLAEKLFRSGSLSQAAMSRANSNLKAAESELAEAKESLGARAYQVQ